MRQGEKVMKKYIVDGVEFDADIVMEMFKEVFDYVGSFVLEKDDDELQTIIFEDYDFYYPNLADFRLNILYDSHYITDEMRHKAQEMRAFSEKMLNGNLRRSASVIRKSPEWRQIFLFADEIKAFLADGKTNKSREKS